MDYEIYYTAFRAITDKINVLQDRIAQFQDSATKGYLSNPQIINQMTVEIAKQRNRLTLLNTYADLTNTEFMKKYWDYTNNCVKYSD